MSLQRHVIKSAPGKLGQFVRKVYAKLWWYLFDRKEQMANWLLEKVSTARLTIQGALFIPNGKRVKCNTPWKDMKADLSRSFMAISTCQYPILASNIENIDTAPRKSIHESQTWYTVRIRDLHYIQFAIIYAKTKNSVLLRNEDNGSGQLHLRRFRDHLGNHSINFLFTEFNRLMTIIVWKWVNCWTIRILSSIRCCTAIIEPRHSSLMLPNCVSMLLKLSLYAEYLLVKLDPHCSWSSKFSLIPIIHYVDSLARHGAQTAYIEHHLR